MALYSKLRANLEAAIAEYPGSLASLCSKAGYDPTYVRRIVKGEMQNPTIYFVECMAAALGTDPLELLGANSEQA